MKTLCVLTTILFSIICKGQLMYKCSYADSLGLINLENAKDQARNSLKEKKLPDDVIEQFISKAFTTPYLQVQSRLVDVYQDSTLIKLNYVPQNNTDVFLIDNIKYMVREGALYKYNSTFEMYVPSNISETSQQFLPTGNEKNILGYLCKEYISLDSVYKIWSTTELPSEINPGVGIKNIKAAILGFEVKKQNTFTISILNKLELIKNPI